MIVVVYRDTKTGRWAKKSTWKRSKAQGGNRYVRKRYERKPKRIPPPPPPAKGPVREWIVTFNYEQSGRTFDVIVTARNEQEALAVAKEYLMSQPNARNIVRAKFSGWDVTTARGPIVNFDVGEAEYRAKSKA